MRWLDGITDSMLKNLSKLFEMLKTGKSGVFQYLGCKELDTTE